MYREIKDGSCEVIYNDYPCWVPPVPERHEILFSNLPVEQQYWRRTPVPDAFKDLFREEAEIRRQEQTLVDNGQKKKVTYLNPILEKYRRQEFHRRLWGVWFFNNGIPVYITGHHYFYLQWYLSDNGYPNYYEFSRKAFYFRQYSEEDPFAMGYLIIGPRGTGKSQEELACILNNMLLRHNASAALQSKNFEKDSKGVLFKTKAVLAFNSLPEFFKPVYSHGSQPENGFAFTRTAIKGKGAKDVEYGEDYELNSYIFPVLPGNMALDGDTIAEIFEDEVGKTDPAIADVYERHTVNLKVVYRNHKKVGLMRKTSTVEKMTVGGAQCSKLWKDSDPKKRDPINGQTVSKINRLFISSLDTDTVQEDVVLPDGNVIPAACDRYGHVNRKIANQKIQSGLDLVKHDYVKMSSEMRKNPRHEAEAFIPDQSQSIFNIQLLTDRLHVIRNEMTRPPYTTGNLYWLDKKFGPVGFKSDQHAGRFNFAWFPDEYLKIGDPKEWKMLNNIGEEWGYDTMGKARVLKFPKNDHLYRIGTDPIKYSKTKDPRASKAAIHGFRLYDMADYMVPKADWKSHNFIFEYCTRPDDPETYLEDMAMACIFLGCKILPERNIPSANTYFEQNGLHKFLAYPRDFIMSGIDLQINSDDAGYASTPEVIDHYTRRIIKFINEHIHRMPFDNTIEDWLNFDSTNPTKSHATVSSGFTLVHAEKIAELQEETEDNIESWFNRADNSGTTGRWIEDEAA